MKKQVLLLVTMILVLSLTACQQRGTSGIPNELGKEQISQTENDWEQQEQTDEQSGADEDAPRGELLFQDERISIYAADDKGYAVTLVYGEYSQRFEGFNSLRPYCTTWEADADGDGIKELYLIHTIGSGTGVSVDALIVCEPNGDNLDIYCHDSEVIRARFNVSCKGIYSPEQQTLQLSYGESSYTCNLSDFYYRDYIPTATKTVFISGDQIHYSSAGNNTVRLSCRLSFEAEGVPLFTYLPEDADVSCLICFNGAGFETVEELKFINAPEYPWMIPKFTSIGYEEFFAHDRAYYDLDTPWFGYGYARNSAWFAGDGEARALYGLRSDEEGFYIYENGHKQMPCYRIPNTQDLVDCNAVITNTRQLYCAVDGTLLRVDVLTGERDTLYTAEYIPDMELCYNDVLYFLAVSDGILSLNRLYVPTMTLDVLYAQTAPEVPVSCYDLHAPASNRSTITWETINPLFWQAVTEILEGPESEYPELYYPDAFTFDYMTAHPFIDEAVQHNFALLQDVLGLRPRTKCYYDPIAGTYEEKYGIYDVCFFGTGIHNDEEHFE